MTTRNKSLTLIKFTNRITLVKNKMDWQRIQTNKKFYMQNYFGCSFTVCFVFENFVTLILFRG